MVNLIEVKNRTERLNRSLRKYNNGDGDVPKGERAVDVVRALGEALCLKKARSSSSYYGVIECEGLKKIRVSGHPANGHRIKDESVDSILSIVVYKDGEHKGEEGTYQEIIYDLKKNNAIDIFQAIIKGISDMMSKGEYIDHTKNAVINNYVDGVLIPPLEVPVSRTKRSRNSSRLTKAPIEETPKENSNRKEPKVQAKVKEPLEKNPKPKRSKVVEKEPEKEPKKKPLQKAAAAEQKPIPEVTETKPSDDILNATITKYKSVLNQGASVASDISLDGTIVSKPNKVGDTCMFMLKVPGSAGDTDRVLSVVVPVKAFEKMGRPKEGDAVSIKGAMVKEPKGKGEKPNFIMVGNDMEKSKVLAGRLTLGRIVNALLWKTPVTLVRAAGKLAIWGVKTVVNLFPYFLGCFTIVGIPRFLAKLLGEVGEGIISAHKSFVNCIPGKSYGEKRAASIDNNNVVLDAAMKNSPAVFAGNALSKAISQAAAAKESEEKTKEVEEAPIEREFQKNSGEEMKKMTFSFTDIVGDLSNNKYICQNDEGNYVYTDTGLNTISDSYKGLLPFGSTELGPEFGIGKFQNGTMALIDKNGKQLIAGITGMKVPVDGVCVLRMKNDQGKGIKEVLFDLKSKEIIGSDLNFKKCSAFNPVSNLANVVMPDGKQNLMNKDGKLLSKEGFSKLLGYYGEIPVIKTNNGEARFLAPDGNQHKSVPGASIEDLVPSARPKKTNKPMSKKSEQKAKGQAPKAKKNDSGLKLTR